jgi:hypothetical protein
MIDSLLAEYNYPANTKNAARAGYEAARRLLALSACAAPACDTARSELGEKQECPWCGEEWYEAVAAAPAGEGAPQQDATLSDVLEKFRQALSDIESASHDLAGARARRIARESEEQAEAAIRALASAPQQVRMLTAQEIHDALTLEVMQRGNPHEAIQRKFCEVNGLELKVGASHDR